MKRIAMLILAAAAVLMMGGAAAAENNVPSLFHNDEAWYKDGIAPLVQRGGIYYVPAELFGMFEGIGVSTPTGNNLLIENTETGAYISILFMERTAAVNGIIISGVNIFRDNGIYYVDAVEAADTLGISHELIELEGGVSMRLYDENYLLSVEELIEPYLPSEIIEDEFAGVHDRTDDDLKRIFILCREPEPNASVTALDMLRKYEMEYTLFLDEDSSAETLIEAYTLGEYGIITDTSGEAAIASLNEINEQFYKIIRFKTHLTLTTGSDELDDALRAASYFPLMPDFRVTRTTDSDVMFADMMKYLEDNEYCLLMVEDCWQTERMLTLIDEIDREKYITSNLEK